MLLILHMKKKNVLHVIVFLDLTWSLVSSIVYLLDDRLEEFMKSEKVNC